ncbi:AAA domain-containing protein [Chitinophaga niastensis]|uniref:AAA domain-containing protein n=1 Tax=Chitinophaga niastensis TaxID=536980 RepID=A0A2P8H912_CHINA|nr:AAA domain-containing protein [Chitinophaga niastensis]PSL42708.1 AAA domain-containing protein [Chitinophaga niastensis]
MNKKKAHSLNVLKFWRAIEAFNLPDLPEQKIRDTRKFTQLRSNVLFPWETPSSVSVPDRKWKHTIYFGCMLKQRVLDVIRTAVTDDEEQIEPLLGSTWLSAIVVDEKGCIYYKTYTRAAFSYAVEVLIAGTSLDKVKEDLDLAYTELPVRFGIEEVEEDDEENIIPLTWIQIENEINDLRKITSVFREKTDILCVSELIHATTEPETPFLNSFYTADLSNLIDLVHSKKDIGQPLTAYLQEKICIEDRYDIQENGIIIQCIHPQYQSAARWPSNPVHGLHSAQQAAVYMSLSKLHNESGLLGVNGPPGTGKTTLLREVVADVILKRAERLLDTGVNKLFSKKRIFVGDSYYYNILSGVFANDGILISSNNNTAVENISKELPQVKSIDVESFPHASYFIETAQKMGDKEQTWAILSAVLGNSTNCKNFRYNLLTTGNFGKLLNSLDNEYAETHHKEEFHRVATELKALLSEFKTFQKIAATYHEGVLALYFPKDYKRLDNDTLLNLKNQLIHTYKILPENIIDQNVSQMKMADIHRMLPYSSVTINTLRSNIFLKSLELIEHAIKINARHFKANIEMFLNMLAGKNTGLINDAAAKILWDTFFFCIPVVSSALASIERFLKKLGQADIGWLMLDEAGQATPQSACGAIWRSQRCIVIGDTLQVMPVVTVSELLGKVLQKNYDIPVPYWSPLYSSTQLLADRTTAFGTYVLGKNEKIWTGFPLRAHRRCADPMFTISNTIAYDGQMVKVTQDGQLNISIGKSTWIDVRSNRNHGHIITDEIEALREKMNILHENSETGTIYIISPFKSVASECQQIFDDVECGTIHRFQGKEADIVFIILGSDPYASRAREWVAQAPNMLNVAVTRAKKYVYVIGNRELWKLQPYFSYLAEILPVEEYRKENIGR